MRSTASRRVRASSPGTSEAITFSVSKATKVASSTKPNACWLSRVFPPQGIWEKEHGRYDHRRLARVAVSPEEIGLCGCWQIIAVERSSQKQHEPKESASREIGYYASSLSTQQYDEQALLKRIRGHWSAI